MNQDETIGAISVSRMIWLATVLSLGVIYYCRSVYEGDNPTIMDTALQYPYTVYMRMGVMYSLFILFLVNIFIKWWIDSSQIGKRTKMISFGGTIAFLAYGLFICTIDRKRINFVLAEDSVFVASIANIVCLTTIFTNLRRIHEQKPYFVGYLSWKLKLVFFSAYAIATVYGIMIYLGFADIKDKNMIEYITVTATYMFYWTFVFDFKGYKMDITNFIDFNQPAVHTFINGDQNRNYAQSGQGYQEMETRKHILA